ncbi:MAG: 2,3-bisphosphoglycerate-independent phosphoglycerate mutase [SAR324 cluster bacterium]|nr:2,3-bisphosphoglycerate-independent phosphoglycerate mutase [SAR324 cluster bacterium]
MTVKQLAEYFHGRSPLIHVVLDGWGIAPASDYNAISQAKTPAMDRLLRSFPHTQLLAHGLHVGLPNKKDMGGSEVGHMTMGSGIIMEQGPTYIKRLIDTGEFQKGPVLAKVLKNCLDQQTPLHLIGLLSDGNIHSHLDHFIAIIRHAYKVGVKQLYVHALLDGRDTAIQSAQVYIDILENLFEELKQQRPGIDYAFASGGGREVITMDRDNNWPKVEAGWNVHVRGESPNRFESITQAVEHFRQEQKGIVDQDLPGFVLVRKGNSIAPIRDQHSVIFMNFRADRAIEFTQAMLEEDFPHFDRSPLPKVVYAGMMVYDQETQFPENHLVGATVVDNPFGKRILEKGLTQFRLTETQKFAHVTFFYNGGYRNPLDPKAEIYQLIASDKVLSFDLAPEMKADEIQRKAVEFISSRKFDYGLINFANADMVGHTGNLKAAIAAVEATDRALGKIIEKIKEVSGLLVVTADHGNADQMLSFNKKKNLWEPDTKHSLNPVPFVIYDPLFDNNYQLKPHTDSDPLNLSQIAATNFILLGQAVPSDINDSLFLI